MPEQPQQIQLPLTPEARAADRKEEEIVLCFDGGCIPARGFFAYGSYAFLVNGRRVERVRLEFGENQTSNIAEWETLAVALDRLRAFCDPATTHVLVRGDSKLVVEGAARRWKVKAQHLRPIAERVWALVPQFAEVRFEWWRRNNSVAILGH